MRTLKRFIKGFIEAVRVAGMRIHYSTLGVEFCKGVQIDSITRFEGGNVINDRTIIRTSSVGYGTYIGRDSYIYDTKIGKYCSIAPNFQTVFGRHPTSKLVSTHPAFFSILKQSGFTYVQEQRFEEIKRVSSDFISQIGNDVFIGANVTIFDGVRIGDGAVIGAGAFVFQDIEPYAVYAGNPLKFIKYRFSKEEIERLLALQ